MRGKGRPQPPAAPPVCAGQPNRFLTPIRRHLNPRLPSPPLRGAAGGGRGRLSSPRVLISFPVDTSQVFFFFPQKINANRVHDLGERRTRGGLRTGVIFLDLLQDWNALHAMVPSIRGVVAVAAASRRTFARTLHPRRWLFSKEVCVGKQSAHEKMSLGNFFRQVAFFCRRDETLREIRDQKINLPGLL